MGRTDAVSIVLVIITAGPLLGAFAGCKGCGHARVGDLPLPRVRPPLAPPPPPEQASARGPFECRWDAECDPAQVCMAQRCVAPPPSAYPDPRTVNLPELPATEQAEAARTLTWLESNDRGYRRFLQNTLDDPAAQARLASITGRLSDPVLAGLLLPLGRPLQCGLPGQRVRCALTGPMTRALLRLVGHPRARVRYDALVALHLHCAPAERPEVVRFALHVIEADPNPLVRAEALRRFFATPWLPAPLSHPLLHRLRSDRSLLVRQWALLVGEPRVPAPPWTWPDPRDRYHSVDFWLQESRAYLGRTCRDHELELMRRAQPQRSLSGVTLDDLRWAPLACTEPAFKACFLECKSLEDCPCRPSATLQKDLELTSTCLKRIFDLAEQAEPPVEVPGGAHAYRKQLRELLTATIDSLSRRCNVPAVAACVHAARSAKEAAFDCTGGLVTY